MTEEPWPAWDGDGHTTAEEHLRAALDVLGLPCEDESTRDTPGRFLRALAELTAGTRVDPDRHFVRTFPPPPGEPGMIIVPRVPISSVCEHHLLPFTGTATVAYVPAAGARVVGLSKLARVAQEYAARPQMQERLGDQIVGAVTRCLDTVGAACLISSVHTCMTIRGARATGAAMITTHYTGQFRADPALRAELLQLAGQGL